MRQLLTRCGEPVLCEKPPHGSWGSSVVLGGKFALPRALLGKRIQLTSYDVARAIQDQLLRVPHACQIHLQATPGAISQFPAARERVRKPTPNFSHQARISLSSKEIEGHDTRTKEESVSLLTRRIKRLHKISRYAESHLMLVSWLILKGHRAFLS
jgi:hypothetical protein